MKNIVLLLPLLFLSTLLYSQASDEFEVIQTTFAKDEYFRKECPENKAKYKRVFSVNGQIRKTEVYDLKADKLLRREMFNEKDYPVGVWIQTNYKGNVDTLDYDFDLQAYYDNDSLCSMNKSDSTAEEHTDPVLLGAGEEGTTMAIYRFVATNTRYPNQAKDAGITGTVFLQFVVDHTGEVNEYHILRGVHPSLDAESIRVVKKLKFTQPATVNGEAVNLCYSLPIRFNLR